MCRRPSESPPERSRRRGVHDEDLLAVQDQGVPVRTALHREATGYHGGPGVPERRGAPLLTRGQGPQPAIALLIGGAVRENQAGQGV